MHAILLQASSQANWSSMILFVGMFAIIIFTMIIPQQQAKKKHKKYLEALKKGDQAVTNSGIHGRITNIGQTTVDLEVDRGVTLTIEKSFLSYDPKNPQDKK